MFVSSPASSVVGLDIQDDMGRHEVGFVKDTSKIPINAGRGCRFESHFLINRVPGNFHVSTHSAGVHQPDQIDMTHVIHKLTFGEDLTSLGLNGGFNSLANADRTKANGTCRTTQLNLI